MVNYYYEHKFKNSVQAEGKSYDYVRRVQEQELHRQLVERANPSQKTKTGFNSNENLWVFPDTTAYNENLWMFPDTTAFQRTLF